MKPPNVIIQKAVESINSLPSAKYGVEPDKIEKRSLESGEFKEWFDIRRLPKISKPQPRYEKYKKNEIPREKKKA